jgi:hypothetical protein
MTENTDFTPITMIPGYTYREAGQFIEMCLDLDAQDDRAKDKTNPDFQPQIDTARWNPAPLYDSRQAVAQDLATFIANNNTPPAGAEGWRGLYAEIVERGKKLSISKWDAQSIEDDPRINGFGPNQIAWTLYEGRGEFAGAYAIAVRGTVFTSLPSAVEDFLTQPVYARQFLSAQVSFAEGDGCTLHSGFAHGTFSLLLDDRYGVLHVLQARALPQGTRLFVTGHSQGAAMASLCHAFLHTAAQQTDGDVFGLVKQNYQLKSYVFAQPKPGNVDFAAEFARHTQQRDSALVINNDIDVVPLVPLTLQDLDDITVDIPSTSWKVLFTKHVVGAIGYALHGLLGHIAEPLTVKFDAGFGNFFNYNGLKPLGKDRAGESFDFQSAGHVLFVYGDSSDRSDLFVQHHAYTYRKLMRAQLNY